MTTSGGTGLSLAYDGSLRTGQAWTGAVSGRVGYSHDNDFRGSAISVNGSNSISRQFDADSLLTKMGDFSLVRSSQNGLLTSAAIGSLTDAWTYDSFGATAGYTAAYNGSALFSVQYVRDLLGRITKRTETVGSATNVFDYSYDQAGRLSQVKKNGGVISNYAYDANGNRTGFTNSLGSTTTGTYDAQDRLVQYGGTTYTYTANGELLTKTTGGGTTTYQYDAPGNLVHAVLPGGTTLDYVTDGMNRRIGKKVNGTLIQGFLYQDSLRPVAELDGTNAVVSRFVYAVGSTSTYMIKGGTEYRIIADRLGSPRLVVNASTGAVVQEMDYDEFGNVIRDTNPGFQPFGFAGGIYDRDSGLTRFGARDYDASTGRWTAKDPILFKGGDTDLYGYVLNDPVNFVDSLGLYTEVMVWAPVGSGKSAFGHVSVDIDGTSYSFGPHGLDVRPIDDYMNLNNFRSGVGAVLDLTPEQEAILKNAVENPGDYRRIGNNCANPVQNGLRDAGVDIGTSVFPISFLADLMNSGCVTKYNFYPAKNNN
ncbi:MAG: RHS repeat-associated core domain-containing protein [Deltaproteobacteria bacterium]|nr:RHS repeat-associated core domain-containing protein [Deltaproteobacteria bacterium]